jgi:hypothetical protein
MYKPNFDTELPWTRVLDLMNELLEHEIESCGSCGEVEYIIVELNDRTKNILCNLGIKLNEVEDEFYSLEENWIDIVSCVWGDLQWHYGQSLWYTGKKFIVRDEGKEELLEIIKKALTGAKHEACGYDGPDPTWHCCDWTGVVEEMEKVIKKYEGDNS